MDPILRDILDQPKVIAETLAEGARRSAALVERLSRGSFRRVYVVGTGTSNFVGLSGRYALEDWARLPTLALSSMDFSSYALPAADASSLVIAISQSGETFETLAAARAAVEQGLTTIGLTNNEHSSLARACSDFILLRAGKETGPGTKTVTAQNVAMYQFALLLGERLQPARRGAARELLLELEQAPRLVERMLIEERLQELQGLAEQIDPGQGLYFIGAGPFSVLGLQAANIIREVGKLHCYPFEACEFRHGPLEVLSSSSRLLVMSGSSCRGKDSVSLACEAAAKAKVDLWYIGDEGGQPSVSFSRRLLLPPASELLAAQLDLVPLQFLAYRLAKKQGLDPNSFQNIVKTWVKGTASGS